jgi:hypothetical protein
MKKKIFNGLVVSLILSIVISCSTNPTAKIQGVYEVNRDSLKNSLQTEMEGENEFVQGLLNIALENAVIEFCVKGDSINGIIFIAGETVLLQSPILERNDSLIVKDAEFEAYLLPTKTGLSYNVLGSNMTIYMNKTERTEVSSDTKKAIEAEKAAIKEKKEFEQNLGRWQKGNYVDEFGDKTGEEFAFCLIRGTSENSISTQNEVLIKTMAQEGKLSFQIFNSDLSIKESFPDSKFGSMRLKFPDGSVVSEKVFFYNNSAYEAGDKAVLYDFISQNIGIVKVYIDLSTASSYYSDKYQFTIEKNNLPEILNGLNK